MPNIAVTLRQEITRVARREIRRETQILRRASAQYRRLIAELRRETKKLQSDVIRFALQASRNAAPTPRVLEADSGKVRFSAKSVSSQRKRLGISAADYGKLIGVTGHTVYKWEHGTARPRKAQIAALGSLRTLGKREALSRLGQMGEKAPKRRTGRR
jgi:DNA-binding transcriptional regulator YiaG